MNFDVDWEVSKIDLHLNMIRTIQKCRRDGIVSMSRANFRQIVPTDGVSVPVHSYDRLFDETIKSSRSISQFVKG